MYEKKILVIHDKFLTLAQSQQIFQNKINSYNYRKKQFSKQKKSDTFLKKLKRFIWNVFRIPLCCCYFIKT